MAESIVKVPSTAGQDFDFLAFSFNRKHSWDDFGLYRVSDGDRYNTELSPQVNDITAENPSADGTFFFGSYHKQKVFNINFAFEEINDLTLRELKKWLNGKEQGDLWFEEEPYKVYTAKVTGTPSIKHIPFDKYVGDTKTRVYRGEGTVQFTCYWPYAHTPDKVQSRDGALHNGKDLDSYSGFTNNKPLWAGASGLTSSTGTCTGENPGDLPAPFILEIPSLGRENQEQIVVGVGKFEVTIPPAVINTTENDDGTKTTTYTHYNNIKWDSKTGIISGKKTTDASEKAKPIPYVGNALGSIPVGGIGYYGIKTSITHNGGTTNSYDWSDCTLTYHYWYY